jgi:hypoxanthine phosphoribosyltransferase
MGKRSIDNCEVLISEDQLRQRIAELGRQISQDFEGRVVDCVGVLENGFVFVADLVRAITCDVHCQFVKPYSREIYEHNITTTEIFYAPEVAIEGKHVLLCEGILSTGHTTDFLARNFQARGAASVAICSLLDRQSNRQVNLDVAYSGFQVGNQWVAGFGLGTPILNRNLPFICVVPNPRD